MKLWNDAVLSYFVNLFKDQQKSRKANCESEIRQFWKLVFLHVFNETTYKMILESFSFLR